MANGNDLATRFVFGSNHIAPGSGPYDFYGIPQDLKNASQYLKRGNRLAEEMGKQMIAAQLETQKTIQSNHAESILVLNEIGYSINELSATVEEGFDRVEDAISYLQEAVCAELAEIKWVLVQLDEKFATLLHLVRFPRETEAAELVEDGLKAFKTKNFDDAERCFREAIAKKAISFQGHMNLAFVLLHKNEAEQAIVHFTKAADYAPPDEPPSEKLFNVILKSADGDWSAMINEVQTLTGLDVTEAIGFLGDVPRTLKTGVSKAEAEGIKKKVECFVGRVEIVEIGGTVEINTAAGSPFILALENLARAYFAAKNYSVAVQVMDDALGLRKQRGKIDIKSYYHRATYGANVGADGVIETVLWLCKKDPAYFAMAVLDEDFSAIRPQLISALEKLARSEHVLAQGRLQKTKLELSRISSEAGKSLENEISRIRNVLAQIEEWLGKRDYRHSVRANQLLVNFDQLLSLLREFARIIEFVPEPDSGEQYDRMLLRTASLIPAHHCANQFYAGLGDIEKMI